MEKRPGTIEPCATHFNSRPNRADFSIENFDPESAGILKTDSARACSARPESHLGGAVHRQRLHRWRALRTAQRHSARRRHVWHAGRLFAVAISWKGNLVLSHRGVVREFDWGKAIEGQKNPNQLHWAAFFGDVDHQIERVWSGARVTLTYLLRRGESGAPSRDVAGEDLAPRIQEAWRALLADPEVSSERRNSRLSLLPSLPPGCTLSA